MEAAADTAMAGADTYLVYVNPAPPGVACQAHQLGILVAALGGEEKAKAAMVYNYKNVMSGFSARLTPSELEAVKNQPQVNRVLPSAKLQLMSSNFEGVS
ncbi:hypothetical protein PR202_ga14113 [Eleusine coracana subsp. coracana]|uniref:Inhibitor I9 domain-containing protein n=1 Tax=Eleusine coracana subsp. coracana TaxID=191504 RepID=A0AAV5CGG8_ELECO|nr:hypothetical protein PR202_ga14113 [Eleusine coracana subsp. coracana]